MIVRQIYAWARATPERTAIVYCGRPFNYRDFALRIEHARQTFAQHRLQPGSVVAISIYYMLDAWVVALALQSLGLITIAFGSREELAALGFDDLACIVSDAPEVPDTVTPRGCATILVRRGLYLGEVDGTFPDPERMTIIPGGQLMLTSGTTGARKKILYDDRIEAVHQPILVELCGLNRESVVCIFNFGLSSGLVFMARTVWNLGGTVIIDQRPDLHLSLADPTVTYAHASPAILSRLLAKHGGPTQPRDTLTIGVAGGALSADLAEQVRTRVSPNLHVFVASTECGGWGATKIDSAEDLQSHKIMPDREVQVVDDMGRPLPAGQIGEIRIGIIDGTTGYFRDEAASRIAFRDGYFYSGDLGFFRADGRLVLQGRMNDVLNIAGQKTAPEPVEEALKARLGVGEVCVIAVAARGADEEIHVVVEAEQDIADNRLIATWSALTRGAPPPRFHIVAALPRTETGKVQRSALRDQIRSGAL